MTRYRTNFRRNSYFCRAPVKFNKLLFDHDIDLFHTKPHAIKLHVAESFLGSRPAAPN